MSEARQGDTVRVHYTGKLEDGTVFDSSRQREPLQVTLGAGQLIPGFEEALFGMKQGDSKQVNVPAAQAYGDRRDEMVVQFDRAGLPPDVDPQVGQQLQLRTREGHGVPATVVGVTEEKVTVDANHPLAGKDLMFDLELVEIV